MSIQLTDWGTLWFFFFFPLSTLCSFWFRDLSWINCSGPDIPFIVQFYWLLCERGKQGKIGLFEIKIENHTQIRNWASFLLFGFFSFCNTYFLHLFWFFCSWTSLTSILKYTYTFVTTALFSTCTEFLSKVECWIFVSHSSCFPVSYDRWFIYPADEQYITVFPLLSEWLVVCWCEANTI